MAFRAGDGGGPARRGRSPHSDPTAFFKHLAEANQKEPARQALPVANFGLIAQAIHQAEDAHLQDEEMQLGRDKLKELKIELLAAQFGRCKVHRITMEKLVASLQDTELTDRELLLACGYEVTDDAVRAVASALQEKNLTSLKLDSAWAKIGGDGVKDLVAAIKHLPLTN